MSKCKFKVGDHVIASDNLGMFKNKPGVIVKINEVYTHPYNIHFDGTDSDLVLWSHVSGLVDTNKKIVITTEGVKYVTAKLYDGETVKVAEAKCAPEDTFDFMVGAKLAVERLTKMIEPPKPKYYNGKVVCVGKSITDNDFTVGKVYEITDGKFIDNKGAIRPAIDERVIDLNDLINGEYFGNWHYKFIPFVED